MYVRGVRKCSAVQCSVREARVKKKLTKQGWTKFSSFGDLDALSEEEWDKVLYNPVYALPRLSSLETPLTRSKSAGR